jgi:hypothetical protein
MKKRFSQQINNFIKCDIFDLIRKFMMKIGNTYHPRKRMILFQTIFTFLLMNMLKLSHNVLCRSLTIIAFVLALGACGDSSVRFDAQSGEFEGTWDVRFSLTFDTCGFLGDETTGFDDVHIVDSNLTTPSLTLAAGEGNTLKGVVDSNGLAQFKISGKADFFNNGSSCSLSEQYSYQGTDTDQMNSVYFLQVVCPNGKTCETRAVGSGKRR